MLMMCMRKTDYVTDHIIFTARNYASAVLDVSLCLSVCLCVCHKPVLYKNGCMMELFFWHTGFLRLITYCIFRKLLGISKIRVIPSGTLFQILQDLKNLATARP